MSENFQKQLHWWGSIMMRTGDMNIYSKYVKTNVNINDKNKFEKESSSG